MRAAGSSSYNWTWAFHDTTLPSWNLLQGDRLRMVVKPTGGLINPGWDMKASYVWHPGA